MVRLLSRVSIGSSRKGVQFLLTILESLTAALVDLRPKVLDPGRNKPTPGPSPGSAASHLAGIFVSVLLRNRTNQIFIDRQKRKFIIGTGLVVETKKSHSLPSASWSTQEADSVIH